MKATAFMSQIFSYPDRSGDIQVRQPRFRQEIIQAVDEGYHKNVAAAIKEITL